MSRQNKVNPGMYTQRGRLAQDDAAREIAKQRSVGSEHTWQPVQRDAEPRLTSEFEGDDEDAATEAPDEAVEETVTAKSKSAPKTVARKAAKAPARKAKAPARKTGRAKKSAAPAIRAKAKRGRTTKMKAKSAKRRKS